MSEQETNEQEDASVEIDWPNVTDLEQVLVTDALQLQEGAKDCTREIFPDLLRKFAAIEAEDGSLGISFIKAGVDECEDPKEKAAKKALIDDCENQRGVFAEEQEEAPAANAAEQVDAPKKATPSKKSTADNVIDLSVLARDFRAAIERIETLERRVISDAAEIEKLKSERQDASEKLDEWKEMVEKGVVTLFDDVSERIKPLEDAKAAADAKEKAKIPGFLRP